MICPVCGNVAVARVEREEPVTIVGHDQGWDRRLAAFQHANGVEHIITIKPMFRPLIEEAKR